PAAAATDPAWKVIPFATGFQSNRFGAGPIGIAFDASGATFVTDFATGQLYRFSALGGSADAASAIGTPIAGAPAGLAFSGAGHLYVARQSQNDVAELDPSTGNVLRVVASPIPCATGLAYSPVTDDLFVSGVGCSGITRIMHPDRDTPSFVDYAA